MNSAETAAASYTRRWLVGATALIGTFLLVIGGWIILSVRAGEPAYRGKPLHFWMFLVGSPDVESVQQAHEALQAMGKPAAGIIGRTLSREASQVGKDYRRLWVRLPIWFERTLPRPASREDLLNDSFLALGLMGKPAIHTLVSLLQSRDPGIRYLSVITLASIGKPAIPALIPQLQSWNAGRRKGALRALAFIQETPESVLLNAAHDSNPEIRTEAELALKARNPDDVQQRIKLLTLIAMEAVACGLDSNCHRFVTHLQMFARSGSYISELFQLLGSPSLRADPAAAANAAVVASLLFRLTNADPNVRATAQSAWKTVKWDGDAELVFGETVTFYLNSENGLARQEAAFAAWRQRPSSAMIDRLVAEFQAAPDLETGTRLLNHFEEMGDAVKPHIPTNSNTVFTTPQLRSLSNQVLRLQETRSADRQSGQ